MDFNSLVNYTTLIQLISAVNFAYIFSRFHQCVYHLIFNESKFFQSKFTSFINDLTVDVQSLDLMEPIETTRGASNAQALSEIKEEFSSLRNSWDIKRETITSTLNKVKTVKGIRSLFLFVSLFCLLDLFNIATCRWCGNAYMHEFAIVFSMASIVVPLILTCYILCFKWAEDSEVYCYKWTSWSFVITVASSFLILGINEFYLGFDFLCPLFYKISFVLSVLIPFYACIFSVLYIAFYGWRLSYLAGNDTKQLRDLQKKLHEKKMSLDASYNMFRVNSPIFG